MSKRVRVDDENHVYLDDRHIGWVLMVGSSWIWQIPYARGSHDEFSTRYEAVLDLCLTQQRELLMQSECLLDRFAMAALTGLIAADGRNGEHFAHQSDMAKTAFSIADWMLKRRTEL